MSRLGWAIIAALITAAILVSCVFTGNDSAEGAQIGGKTVTLFHCDRTVPRSHYALVSGRNGQGIDLVFHASSFGAPGSVILYCTPVRAKR